MHGSSALHRRCDLSLPASVSFSVMWRSSALPAVPGPAVSHSVSRSWWLLAGGPGPPHRACGGTGRRGRITPLLRRMREPPTCSPDLTQPPVSAPKATRCSRDKEWAQPDTTCGSPSGPWTKATTQERKAIYII